jgi:hypothetical protein
MLFGVKILMNEDELYFGRVSTYVARQDDPFGFIKPTFASKDVYFKGKQVGEALRAFLLRNQNKHHFIPDLYFWFTVKIRENGQASAVEIWENLAQVPDNLVKFFAIERLKTIIGSSVTLPIKFETELHQDRRTSGILSELENDRVFRLDEHTERINRILGVNFKLLAENNFVGIRKYKHLSSVCLGCGRHGEGLKNRFCSKCETRWYSNVCWRCHSDVDDRDPETPACEVCGWCRCFDCGACEDGCPRCIDKRKREVGIASTDIEHQEIITDDFVDGKRTSVFSSEIYDLITDNGCLITHIERVCFKI